MRERTLWFILAVVVGITAIAGGIYTVIRNQTRQSGASNSDSGTATAVFSSTSSAAVADFFKKDTAAPLQPAAAAAKFNRTAWIPDWDWVKGYDTVKANPKAFDSISPVWYYVDKDGITRANRTGLTELKALTKANNIKLIPSIANFNSVEFNKILGNETKLREHIAYLQSEVTKYGYDGLDLDYESIQLDDQQAFLTLVRELYDFLNPQGKILTIAVMSNHTDSDVLRSGRQTRHTQAWQEVGNYVHEFRIMSYDMTGNRSQYPGPISPVDWLEGITRYALPRVDSQKIMLGINLYAYGGWSDNLNLIQPYLSFLTNPWLEKGQASALLYSDILSRRANTVTDVLDPATKEKILRYRLGGKDYYAFYLDAETVAFRHALAKQYNLGGVAYWRLGGEDMGVHKL